MLKFFGVNEMNKSDVKPKIDNITILHDVLLPFNNHFSGLFYGMFGAIRDEIIILDHFCPDKPSLEIGMN
jgi:hypothetical protein